MKRRFLLFVAVFASAIGACSAAVPGRINYQGKLTDASGRLVTDGSYDLVFTLFDDPSAGDEKWSEPHDNVRVSNGLFNVVLGAAGDLIPVFRQNDALYLEIAVEGEALAPRQQVVSAGYALRAEGVSDGAITEDSLSTGAVTADKISVPGLDSDGYSLPRLPTVISIIPDTKGTGYSSFTATITGQNFQTSSRARVGSVDLSGEAVSSSTSMTAGVPAGIPAGVYDVSVSNINFDWGTGSDLFTVETPTPTTTPTPTPTATPTATPTSTPTSTPWGASACSMYAGTAWCPLGNVEGYGCWFYQPPTNGVTCNDVCQAKGLVCDTRPYTDNAYCACDALYSPHNHHGGGQGVDWNYNGNCHTGESVPVGDLRKCDTPNGGDYLTICVCKPL